MTISHAVRDLKSQIPTVTCRRDMAKTVPHLLSDFETEALSSILPRAQAREMAGSTTPQE
jgi:hypothetical protein